MEDDTLAITSWTPQVLTGARPDLMLPVFSANKAGNVYFKNDKNASEIITYIANLGVQVFI